MDERYLEAAKEAENEDTFYFGYGLGLSAGLAEIALILYGGAVDASNALSAGAASMSGGGMAMQTTAGTVVVVGGGTAVAEGAVVLYPVIPRISHSSKKGESEPDHMIGENGAQTSSKTTWKNGRTERIDVENPDPGERPGQIHYHDPIILNGIMILKIILSIIKRQVILHQRVYKSYYRTKIL